jgi:hypothetical protein
VGQASSLNHDTELRLRLSWAAMMIAIHVSASMVEHPRQLAVLLTALQAKTGR